ncbi:hypothetical protein BJ508DRAFT_418268 [Ascobolus immersus RN42]|uniref:Uncharacterized protein n=1 Tax=Ascobolus immersus RN42 TaxID=1160509 RepID=A0A3N4HZT8_ASCIM|nr:hypothetical protein BJ508DRAFT_418268 [Ascobolus immersus RN42]
MNAPQKHSKTIPHPRFPAAELPAHLQNNVRTGRTRKPADRVEEDISKCPLMEMSQYSCKPHREGVNSTEWKWRCVELRRLFRQCKVLIEVEDEFVGHKF